MDYFGAFSLLPALAVLILAIITRRPIESLLLGCVIALAMLFPFERIMTEFSQLALRTMKNETIGWIILVCGLMGSLIMIFMRTGAALAFSQLVATRANNRKKALLGTWLLGLFIFLDDYLNALAVGTSMRSLTDKYKVSREMLAYVVDSTAAPICILLPISTWAIFFVGVLESNQVTEAGGGFALYISSIPYMFYAWVAVLVVPLVAAGILPAIGPMKTAEKKAALVEHLSSQRPLSSKKQASVQTHSSDNRVSQNHSEETQHGHVHDAQVLARKPVSPVHFIFPILLMIAVAWFNDMDMLLGVFVTVGITVLMFWCQKVLTLTQLFEAVWDGVRLMVPALAIIISGFMFKDVNEQLGLSSYVIESVKPLMTASMLPLVCFLSIALVTFSTAAFWGVLAITVPIVLPLAQALGTPLPVVIGALMSAAALGSHACFYSDSTVLAAEGCGVGVMEHALTQLPYVLLSAVIASLGWLIWAIV